MEITCLKSYSTSNASISSATRFRGLRVYHLDDFVQSNTDDWDGKLSNNLFTPVMTDTNAAPDEIKRVVSCKFKPIDIVLAIPVPARVVNTV